MTSYYRNKYTKYPDHNGLMKHRPGGEDVHALCNAIEEMEKVVKWVYDQMGDREQGFCDEWMEGIRSGLKSCKC
ncbi:MAG: hypothetical protein ABIL06_13000 [Pseudomonadota bacterium]|uniref:Uncharacterized protein n=1 Tax=viral metagenome TaxID=1070528 RepID=A0A6H1ZGL3_9ZZZZ